MNRNKLLFGLIGLALGFILSFFLTQNYNKKNASAPIASQSTQAAAMGERGGNQEAMMAQVRETMEKARDNPEDFDAQIQAAGVYDQIGRVSDAVMYLKKALEINPKDRRSFAMSAYIANYHMQQKEYVESEKWFRRAAEINPNEPDLFVEIAATYIHREPPNGDKAIEELQRALKVDPKYPHALEHLVEAQVLRKDSRAAEEALGKLKEAEPGNNRISTLQGLIADLKAGKQVTIPKD